MDPVMIRGDRQELILRHDPDRRLKPAEDSVEPRNQNPKALPMVSKVRTAPIPPAAAWCGPIPIILYLGGVQEN